MPVNRWSGPLLALMLFGVGALTLTPQPDAGYGGTGVRCLLCGSRGIADLILNIGLFAPIGFVLAMRRVRPLMAMGIALAIAAGIELVQWFIPGREVNFRDVLANGLGGGLGAGIQAAGGQWIQRTRTARVGALLSLLGVLCIIGATGPLLVPRPGPDRVFVGWNPDQQHLERWSGQVRQVEIGGIAVPAGANVDGAPVRAALIDGVPIVILATAGRPSSGLAGLFTVNDAETNEVLLVGVDGDDLIVRFQRLSSLLRLDTPTLRFPEVLAAVTAGDRLMVRLEDLGRHPCATVNGLRTCAQPFSVGSVWRFLFWRDDAPAGMQRALDALALAALLVVPGLFLPAIGRAHAVPVVFALLAGIVLIARHWGLTLVAPPEFVGGVSGVAIGVVAASRSRARGTGPDGRDR